jgi:glutathione S-transferase
MWTFVSPWRRGVCMGGRVHDSHTCVSYVDEAFDGPPLLPHDPAGPYYTRPLVSST